MKIVHVVPYAMDRPGGVQRHVIDLCNWLDQSGHETRIVAGRGRNGGLDRVQAMGRSIVMSMHGTQFELSLAGPREMGALKRALRAFGAQILHLHTPTVPAIPWQVWRGMGLPTVATLHATLPNPPTDLHSRWLLASAQRWARRLETVIVPSQVPFDQWKGQGITPLPQIMAPAIDLSQWRAAGKDRPAPQGPLRRVISVGRLEGRKGIDTLLAAWPMVRSALPALELTLVGRGAPPRALPQGVTIAPPTDDAALPGLVAQSDLLIAPAGFGESFGLVLAEAMAAGTPVLAAANPAYQSVLGDGSDAQTFAPGDAKALADKLIALNQAPETRALIAERGLTRANLADVIHVGPDYTRLYAEVLARSNRDGRG